MRGRGWHSTTERRNGPRLERGRFSGDRKCIGCTLVTSASGLRSATACGRFKFERNKHMHEAYAEHECVRVRAHIAIRSVSVALAAQSRTDALVFRLCGVANSWCSPLACGAKLNSKRQWGESRRDTMGASGSESSGRGTVASNGTEESSTAVAAARSDHGEWRSATMSAPESIICAAHVHGAFFDLQAACTTRVERVSHVCFYIHVAYSMVVF
jgi:hypothetical protein